MTNVSLKRACGAGLYLACLAVLGLTAACSRSTPVAPMPALFAVIDSLKTDGRYAEALTEAGRAESLGARPGTRPWCAGEAPRLKAALTLIVALPADAQRELAHADSLTRVIQRLMDVDENYVAAADAAARQLEIRSRHLGNDHPDVAASLDILGQIAHLSGEGVRSEEYFKEALGLRRTRLGSNHPLVAETLNHWGVLHKEQFDHRQAEACYREAQSILESAYGPGDLALAPVLQSLGSLYRSKNQFDKAEVFYSRALEIRRRHLGPRSVAAGENLLWLGHSQLCAGKLEAAEKSMTEARTIFFEHNMNLSHAMGDVTWFLGMAAWLRDDCAGAVRFWRETFLCRTNVASNQSQGYGLGQLRGLTGEWIDALLCEGKEDEAWDEVCRGSGPVAESLLKLSAARRARREDSVTIDSLRTEVLAMRDRLAALDGTSTQPSLRVRLARVDAERMILEQSLISHASPVPEDSLTIERIQSFMKPDEAMVGWIQGTWRWSRGRAMKRSIWGFVLRSEGKPRWVHLGTWKTKSEYDAWCGDLARFEKTILKSSQWPHRVSTDHGLDSLGLNISEKIFSPLMPCLAGVSELIVVDGRSSPLWPMKIFPECLVDRLGVPMNERFAFSYTPSPWTFVHLAELSRGRIPIRERSLVAVADPLGPEETPRLATAGAGVDLVSQEAAGFPGPTLVDQTLFRNTIAGDRESLGRLPCLPHSRTEALKVASVFPAATVLMGPGARETSLEAVIRARNPGILHFATHAFIDEVEPGRSALVMSIPAPGRNRSEADPRDDGLITAEDVLLGWNLEADLVTLSGCQTSRGSLARGGEDLGFVQAFLAAGARSLLISRWKVDDLATALFMGRFYENLTGSHAERRAGVAGGPMSKSRSLQEAQIWLRNLKDENGRTPFAHPVYWAGFVLMGNAD